MLYFESPLEFKCGSNKITRTEYVESTMNYMHRNISTAAGKFRSHEPNAHSMYPQPCDYHVPADYIQEAAGGKLMLIVRLNERSTDN